MSWVNIIKRPMMPVDDDTNRVAWKPLGFGRRESRINFEMDLDRLANELNIIDPDVKILELAPVGPIDPTVTEKITDREGEEVEVMTQSPLHMRAGPNKKVWHGLRFILAEPLKDFNLRQLRKRFPLYHIYLAKKKLKGDYPPKATEYYFSPKKELSQITREKHPSKTPIYNTTTRNVQQHKRFIAEAKKLNLLNENGRLDRNKLKDYLIKETENISKYYVIETRSYYYKIFQATNETIPRWADEQVRKIIERVVSKELIAEAKKMLNKEDILDNIYATYQSHSTTIHDILVQKIFVIANKNLDENKILRQLREDKEFDDWLFKIKLDKLKPRKESDRPKQVGYSYRNILTDDQRKEKQRLAGLSRELQELKKPLPEIQLKKPPEPPKDDVQLATDKKGLIQQMSNFKSRLERHKYNPDFKQYWSKQLKRAEEEFYSRRKKKRGRKLGTTRGPPRGPPRSGRKFRTNAQRHNDRLRNNDEKNASLWFDKIRGIV